VSRNLRESTVCVDPMRCSLSRTTSINILKQWVTPSQRRYRCATAAPRSAPAHLIFGPLRSYALAAAAARETDGHTPDRCFTDAASLINAAGVQ